ncbi:FkbM family methyltransferase (plasmid) [Aminobacter sp. BA135]|uniref:FkbM family methyltransferase n=1 Tax=Aminobacter sp. BA135 TaxID=537596 RepID=UPI003D79FE3C
MIFDIGMHRGVDTKRYLSMGYRVVAVEANPVLAQQCATELSDHIASGRLTIENVGIYKNPGSLPFYRNLACDEWSSFVPHLGQRLGQFDTITVDCITVHDLLARHGIPFFMKVDVEGIDEIVAADVGKCAIRPRYISIEDGGFQSLLALQNAGVRHFKFVNQPKAQETFGRSSSGPFGEEIEGPWLTAHEAFAFYCANVRPPNSEPIDGWWDIHGEY